MTPEPECRVGLASDELLDELPSPTAHLGLDRIAPIVERVGSRAREQAESSRAKRKPYWSRRGLAGSGAVEQSRRRIAPQAIARLKAKVRELTRRTRGQSPSQVAKELSR